MKKRFLSAIIIATVVLGATYTPECYAIEEITPPLTKKELREQSKLDKKALLSSCCHCIKTALISGEELTIVGITTIVDCSFGIPFE